jgi:hypothetical protein
MAKSEKPGTGVLIIAVDGPAASGKGTLACRLADHLGLRHLDTGGLYRAVGARVLRDSDDPADAGASEAAACNLTESDLKAPNLRDEEVGQAASILSVHSSVRAALLASRQHPARGRFGWPGHWHRGLSGGRSQDISCRLTRGTRRAPRERVAVTWCGEYRIPRFARNEGSRRSRQRSRGRAVEGGGRRTHDRYYGSFSRRGI